MISSSCNFVLLVFSFFTLYPSINGRILYDSISSLVTRKGRILSIRAERGQVLFWCTTTFSISQRHKITPPSRGYSRDESYKYVLCPVNVYDHTIFVTASSRHQGFAFSTATLRHCDAMLVLSSTRSKCPNVVVHFVFVESFRTPSYDRGRVETVTSQELPSTVFVSDRNGC